MVLLVPLCHQHQQFYHRWQPKRFSLPPSFGNGSCIGNGKCLLPLLLSSPAPVLRWNEKERLNFSINNLFLAYANQSELFFLLFFPVPAISVHNLRPSSLSKFLSLSQLSTPTFLFFSKISPAWTPPYKASSFSHCKWRQALHLAWSLALGQCTMSLDQLWWWSLTSTACRNQKVPSEAQKILGWT